MKKIKILSWNVNGLRAVYKRNFLSWLQKSEADIICLQEIKIQKEKLSSELLNLFNYHSYFNFADKKGYSGVAVYTKEKPKKVESELSLKRFDGEGRILKLDYGNFTLLEIK